MAQLMKDFEALLDGVHFVRQAELNHPYTGELMAHWYVPVERDFKRELRTMILKGHELGYVEAVGDWG